MFDMFITILFYFQTKSPYNHDKICNDTEPGGENTTGKVVHEL